MQATEGLVLPPSYGYVVKTTVSGHRITILDLITGTGLRRQPGEARMINTHLVNIVSRPFEEDSDTSAPALLGRQTLRIAIARRAAPHAEIGSLVARAFRTTGS